MRLAVVGVVVASAVLAGNVAHADEKPTFKDLFLKVAQDPDCKSAEYPDFIMFTCEKQITFWYFTKPNHSAFPGVVKRIIYEENGAVLAREEGTSFASDDAQPAFKAWLAQISDLDRQAREEMAKQRGGTEK